MATNRVTVTIPSELIEAADARARETRRSRSSILSEALRAHLSAPKSLVRETPAAYAAGLGAHRREQLEADLTLTPQERVALAEETVLVGELGRPRLRRHQVLTFDSIEAFHAWERREAMEP